MNIKIFFSSSKMTAQFFPKIKKMNTTDPKNPRYVQQFTRLLTIMNELREKCPWDKAQTIDSIRHLSIEEVYELSDAILKHDLQEVKKELGDLMLHIVFYAKIASEDHHFDIGDVLESICEKLIRRHPHIYGDHELKDVQAVKRNWEKIKLNEENKNKSVLGGVPKSLPALVKAQRIQEKARGVGFDWEHKNQVWEKVMEEIQELQHELRVDESEQNPQHVESEFGDVLFSLINYARFIDVNPETALQKANLKFIKRFNYIENQSKKEGRNWDDMTVADMSAYWENAKKEEKDYGNELN